MVLCISISGFLAGSAFAQEGKTSGEIAQSKETTEAISDSSVAEKLENQVRDIGKTLNESETVQEVSAGILQPIYQAAEWIGFPAFYWIAFAVMVAGVISFAGQLVFAKFFLLFCGRLNIREIAADTLGLAISAIGLILTTQAATQNSEFTRSPAAVVSAAVVGGLAGLVFYWWGQREEFDAARGVAGREKPPESESRRKRARM